MAKAKIAANVGTAAIEAARRPDASRDTVAVAVRFLLQELAAKIPGNSVEVRVPPFGAVQCIEGPGHTRGTPPNVVEMSATVWLALAVGERMWSDALAAGEVHASGSRADLGAYLPVLTPG